MLCIDPDESVLTQSDCSSWKDKIPTTWLDGHKVIIPRNVPNTIDAQNINKKLPILANFINGEFVPSSDPSKFLVNLNPATNEPIGYLPVGCSADADCAVNAAFNCHNEGKWRSASRQARAAALESIADLIKSNMEELAVLECKDTGKALMTARMVDIPRAEDNFRYYAAKLRTMETRASQMTVPARAINYTSRQPVGVCALIAPWNLPLYLMTWKIAPCIGIGNTCVCKPSELTSSTLNRLCQLILEAKILPPGVLNVVNGLGSTVGSALTSHPFVKAISFTGGTVTGKRVASLAADGLKKLSLELGGKNCTIIFDDYDFQKSINEIVRASFANTGQVCLCGSRLLVQTSVYDKFVAAFVAESTKLIVGDPMDPKTTTGSVISREHALRIHNCVVAAVQRGAKCALGGPDFYKGDAFYPITILTDLNHSCIADCEIFGPVVSIHPFTTEDEVVAMANESRYGLAGSVWTSNIDRAIGVSERIETGMIWVNCWLNRDLNVPFGGIKDSGIGREGGDYALGFFSNDKNICLKY